ncbi:MAG: hypothetical protein KC550_00010 [Nanoarchaeota archaeon]|nr:hypothetical protein [Nanoarchaeota archaeon]
MKKNTIMGVATSLAVLAAGYMYWNVYNQADLRAINFESYERIGVDQVFLNRGSYLVTIVDGDGTLIRKALPFHTSSMERIKNDFNGLEFKINNLPESVEKLFPNLGFESFKSASTIVKKDLEKGKNPYVDFLNFSIKPDSFSHLGSSESPYTYSIIHLPRSEKLSAGSGLTSGKYPK